jgi:hypothetical protein
MLRNTVNHVKHICTISLILLIVLLFSTQAVEAKGTGWKIVHSPNAGWLYNTLNSVAIVSTHDAWAVGYSQNHDIHDPELTLIEHWNGSHWSIVPSPNPVTRSNRLFGVATLSSNDAWAVGYSSFNPNTINNVRHALIEHWDGSQWSVIPSPNPGQFATELYSVAAVSSNDIWAVGNFQNIQGNVQTLIEHWDGNQWNISSNSTEGGALYGVSASSSNDVWVVGQVGNMQSFEHWDGKTWSVVPSPAPGLRREIVATTAVSANDVWAVGDYQNSSNITQTLIEHWDGSKWSIVDSPNPGSNADLLTGISAVSSNNIWVVGLYQSSSYDTPLIEHWDGNTWSVFPGPPPSSGEAHILNSVSALSTGTALTVGSFNTFTGRNEKERDFTFTEVF